jgi:hypothetical protein
MKRADRIGRGEIAAFRKRTARERSLPADVWRLGGNLRTRDPIWPIHLLRVSRFRGEDQGRDLLDSSLRFSAFFAVDLRANGLSGQLRNNNGRITRCGRHLSTSV